MSETASDISYILATLRDTARQQHGVDLRLLMDGAARCISQQETLINHLDTEVDRLNRELERAIAERTPHDYGILRSQRDAYRDRLCDSIKETEEARAEVERLKRQEVKITFLGEASSSGGSGGPCAGNDHHVPADTKMIRPEPSRLEIAATLMAGLGNSIFDDARLALRAADALIAAAKGGAK